MAKAILICGMICSGKTTLARHLMEKSPAVLLSMDELMLAVLPPQLGDMHDGISAKCREYLLARAVETVRAGVDVILDWGFWTRADRTRTTQYFRKYGIETVWHYAEVDDGELDARIARRNAMVERGETTAYYVDENLKNKCLERFEPFEKGEIS